MIISSGTQTAN